MRAGGKLLSVIDDNLLEGERSQICLIENRKTLSYLRLCNRRLCGLDQPRFARSWKGSSRPLSITFLKANVTTGGVNDTLLSWAKIA